jgi:hypothetical protein
MAQHIFESNKCHQAFSVDDIVSLACKLSDIRSLFCESFLSDLAHWEPQPGESRDEYPTTFCFAPTPIIFSRQRHGMLTNACGQQNLLRKYILRLAGSHRDA